MPQGRHLRGVSDKEQRQYEHIKESVEESSRYGSRAKEVAARTVMKEHKEKGHKKGKQKVLTREAKTAGRLQQAVVDPRTNEVTEFVMSTDGLLGHDVLVPRKEVDQACPEDDVLRSSSMAPPNTAGLGIVQRSCPVQ
jgi:hypothetical protein